MFFDVEKKTEIASMKIKFTGEVFPLFNPGIKDISPMMILHKAVKDASSCEDNAWWLNIIECSSADDSILFVTCTCC